MAPARGATQPVVDETTGAVPLTAVTADRVRWLWPGRIPLGKLTLLDGDPGLGKSALLLDLAARITRAHPLPDGSRPDFDGPAGVVILSAEDGLADTIRPRLQAAGADLDRVIALRGVWNGAHLRWVRLPRDTKEIALAVRDVRARLVVIDPLMAYLDPKVNAYREQSIRAVLGLLATTAERLDLALVIVRHLTKGADGNPLYRGGGSIGVIGAARSGLVVGADRDARAEAIAFLQTLLANGAIPARTVFQTARQAGLAAITVRRAKLDLRVVARKESDGRWSWSLP